MNQLLNRLPEAQTKLFFGVLILFAAITVYFSPLLAAIEILITALLLVYHLLTRRSVLLRFTPLQHQRIRLLQEEDGEHQGNARSDSGHIQREVVVDQRQDTANGRTDDIGSRSASIQSRQVGAAIFSGDNIGDNPAI